jgi:putative glutamine amidotransferase
VSAILHSVNQQPFNPSLQSSDSVRHSSIVAVTATSEVVKDSRRVRVNRAYTDSIVAAGLIPLVVPPVPTEMAAGILDAVGGLLLTGGEDIDPAYFGAARHPATGVANDDRDRCELTLAREAAARRIPTLAICRGVQVLNVALGGSLIQDLPSERGGDVDHDAKSDRSSRVHAVDIAAGSRLNGIVNSGSIATNSFHHQAVDRLGAGLCTVGTSADGVVEAVECTDRGWWMVGVQWHPEELTGTPEDWDRKLFAAFAAAVKGSG